MATAYAPQQQLGLPGIVPDEPENEGREFEACIACGSEDLRTGTEEYWEWNDAGRREWFERDYFVCRVCGTASDEALLVHEGPAPPLLWFADEFKTRGKEPERAAPARREVAA